MPKEESSSLDISTFKQEVSQILSTIKAIKNQMENREISLEDYNRKKDALENQLRDTLDQISQFKETGTIETKKDATIAEETKRLMHEFQIDLFDSISKLKVFISASTDDHFTFEIDYTMYPEKPKLFIPNSVQDLFEPPLNVQLTVLDNWSTQTPPQIIEIFYEIEKKLFEIFQSETMEDMDPEQLRILRVQQRRTLVAAAKEHVERKDIPSAIEIYKQVIQLCHDLEEIERADKYKKLIEDLENQ